MKLQKMTDFVLEQSKKIMNCELTHLESYSQIVDCANFLKQPLKLEMFVPCDKYGNVLEEKLVENYENDFGLYSDFRRYNKEYNEAKKKVLFEGFKIYKYTKDCIIKDNKIIFEWLGNRFSHTGTTIESLTLLHDNFYLTPNAIKQLRL